MNLIVAVDKNWGIGCKGNLLFYIPEDMRFFKAMTVGNVVVMGHSTFLSLPNSSPLKDRINIVLSRKPDLKIEGAIVCNSVENLLEVVKKYNTDDVFVIGGQQIYDQLLEYCKYAYITRINATMNADTYFKNVDDIDNWKLTETSDVKKHNQLAFTFNKYENISLK